MKLRDDLPPLPANIKALKIDDRGYPVPWFVALVDGKPEFRIADGEKLRAAIIERRCWVCGEKMGRYMAFVLGPMCAINRNSAEPPCHRECAVFSAMACPFLSKPAMLRREGDLPEGTPDFDEGPGIAIKRNPGCALVWVCREYEKFRHNSGYLFTPGEPTEILAFAEGKPTGIDPILRSIESGLPILRNMAVADGAEAIAELRKYEERGRKTLEKFLAPACPR